MRKATVASVTAVWANADALLSRDRASTAMPAGFKGNLVIPSSPLEVMIIGKS
jgi:hypothetical protein